MIAAAVRHLKTRKGSEFASILSVSPAKLLKKSRDTKEPPPWKELHKVSKVSGILNFRYENSVNNQREREGHPEVFEAQSRAWGEHVLRDDGSLSCLIKHRGKHYVELKVQNTVFSYYVDDEGNRYTRSEIADFLQRKSSESSRQELEEPVIVRDYRLDHVVSIRFGNEEMILS